MPILRLPNLAPSVQGFNSAILQDSPSDANMANYADIFAGPSAGHVPTAWESESAGRVADMAERAMGAGPEVDAYRQQARARGAQELEDQAMKEADFFAHGLDRGMTHANVQNQIADVNSEAAAARQMLPNAEALGNKTHADRLELINAQYGIPAQQRALEALQGAQIAGDARVQAAQAAQAPKSDEESLSYKGYMNAIQAILEKTGQLPDAATIAKLKEYYRQAAPVVPPPVQ